MKKPEYMILVCGSFRAGGEPQGICDKKNSTALLGYLETEIVDRGLDAFVAATSCLKLCEQGPAMVIQPQNWWYGGVEDEDTVDQILDALEDGEPASELLIA